MDKQQAQNIIKDTFENHFDKIRFAGFVKNLLNSAVGAQFIAPFSDDSNTTAGTTKPGVMNVAPTKPTSCPDVPRLEAEINKLVYTLYDLTPEEIAIVEGKI